MEKTVKKGRNSSIELLRIVCLVMIFWMHAADSGVANGIGAWIDIAQKTLKVSGIVQGNETLVDNNRENIVRLNSVIEMFHDEK